MVSVRRFLTVVLPAILLVVSCLTLPAQERSDQRGIFGAGQPGEVAIVRREAKRLGLKNFQMQSRSSNGRLAIDGFSAQLGSGIIQGQGLVDWSRPNDTQQLTITFQNVEAAALLRAFEIKIDANLTSMVSGQMNLQWQGVRGSLPRETMQGTIQVNFGQGVVTNAYVLQLVAQTTGINELNRFDFSSGIVAGNIQGGVMRFSQVLLAGPTQSASGTGALDLRTEEVRIKWDIALSPGLASRSSVAGVKAASGAMQKAAGKNGLIKIPLPLAMVGNVRDPQFVLANSEGTGREARE